jgi:hypothetical protein
MINWKGAGEKKSVAILTNVRLVALGKTTNNSRQDSLFWGRLIVGTPRIRVRTVTVLAGLEQGTLRTVM